MERIAQTRQKLKSVRQQLLAVDPGVSARSSTRPRRRCVLAASTCDGSGLDDDGVVERLVATNDATPALRLLHTHDGVSRQLSVHRPAPLHSDDD